MSETTPLDLAHAAMEEAPDDDAVRLRFYHRLADTELFLLLVAEPDGDAITPHVFALEDGTFVAAFDQEERLAAFCDAPAPYAALPGRAIAAQLAGQGIGLALNLGVAPSGHLLPAAAIDWLSETLGHDPGHADARPEGFAAPDDLPQALVAELSAKLSGLGAVAKRAGLARAAYSDGREGALLGFVGAVPGVEPSLAKAVSEALSFSGVDTVDLDVAFLPADGPAAEAFLAVAQELELSPPPSPEAEQPERCQAEPEIPNLRVYRQRDA
ncbi:SseB family protein [Defluviimonas sp. WL0002]|uniref:SseB family protein n=1 Tax=Albidovulum marisflavi TaxID=2984159 RepID=A0ABT2ZCE3_9RHOB|nr:SseB family protein [Defluviimonas sp. WL0002]MCV2868815.1 SseB family protein [Defluviimonas sp. WL0002]